MTEQNPDPTPVERLTGEEAEQRRRTRGDLAASGQQAGTESGSGGIREIVEGMLRAAMRQLIGRGGLSNSAFLAMAVLYHYLRRRRQQRTGQAFFPDEHMQHSTKVTQATVHLARQANSRVVAQDPEVPENDPRRIREIARAPLFQHVDAVLHDEAQAERLERIARESLRANSSDPDTPPEQQWRRALDENFDPSRLPPRELALGWLSAAMSREPGAREAEVRYAEALHREHPQLGGSLEVGAVEDPNFRGDPHATRIDKPTVLAGAVWQADNRPIESMEEYWTKAVAWFKDKRADQNELYLNAKDLVAAVLDGKAPGDYLLTAIDNAKRTIPGFDEAYQDSLRYHEARQERGDYAGFAQGDAFLDALDRTRGIPPGVLLDRPAQQHVDRDTQLTELRQDRANAADPRSILGESRLPDNGRQGAEAIDRNGRAIARPQQMEPREADERRGEVNSGNNRSGEQRVRYLRMQHSARVVLGDSTRVRWHSRDVKTDVRKARARGNARRVNYGRHERSTQYRRHTTHQRTARSRGARAR